MTKLKPPAKRLLAIHGKQRLNKALQGGAHFQHTIQQDVFMGNKNNFLPGLSESR